MSLYSTVTVRVPDIATSFRSGKYDYSTQSVKQSNIQVIKKIDSQYGMQIRPWATLFEIPYGVIVAFIATESSGVMTKPNRFLATGLMQVTPNALYDTAVRWKTEVDSPLPDLAVRELNAKVPEILKRQKVTPELQNKILNLLQNDASFNIMSGTMILRWLLERFSNLKSGQLNKAMVGYNAGAYTKALVLGGKGSKANTTPVDSTALATNLQVPSESRGYLFKMLGKDGFLSLIYKDKVI